MNEKVNRKRLKASGIIALVMVGALLLIGLLELVVLGMKGKLDYLDAGKRWASRDERFAVVSLFSEADAEVSGDEAEGWVQSMDSALIAASVTPNEGARSWAWSYAADDLLEVVGTKGKVNAKTLAVAGDFFVFHQLNFKYGGGFLNDPSNPMGVVLDRDLAWRVYGAENIVGMPVTIGGVEFVIVGVTDRESTSAVYEHAYGTTPRLYMSYAGYRKVASNPVTVFEAALPNPVKGFAKNLFDTAVRVNNDTSFVIEATNRFSVKNRFENMKQLRYAWVSVNKIEYPYWENEARVYDYRAAILMIFEVALAVIAVSSLLLSFIMLRISGYTLTASVKNTWHKFADKREEKKRNQPPKAKVPKEKKVKEPKKEKKEKKSGKTEKEDNPVQPETEETTENPKKEVTNDET